MNISKFFKNTKKISSQPKGFASTSGGNLTQPVEIRKVPGLFGSNQGEKNLEETICIEAQLTESNPNHRTQIEHESN